MKTISILNLFVLLLITKAEVQAQRASVAVGGKSSPCVSESCIAAAYGLRAFLDVTPPGLGGNGRACADCHVPADHFQLSPSNAESRYQFLQLRRQFDPDADDALFRPVDANDYRTQGDGAADYTNLRLHGLIRVNFPLPPNMKLVDPLTDQASNENSVDVWRAVPPIGNVALTGPDGQNPSPRSPNNTGGYQRDARFGSLQQQARGALIGHMQVQSEPRQQLLDDLAAFELGVFTSAAVRTLADAVRAGTVPLPPTDPPLSELETQGKSVFARACAHCHGGPGQSTTYLPVVFRFHDTGTHCPRPVDTVTPARFAFTPCPPELESTVRTYEITLANGDKTRRRSSDPGRALLTGFVGGPPPTDDWNKLDVPGLHGIRYTAPYFHSNSAATLEDVVDHYVEFFKFVQSQQPPGVVPPVASTDGVNWDRQPRPEERAALLAYLRKL